MIAATASNAELLALLVGKTTAQALAHRPLAELFAYTAPRQGELCEVPQAYNAHPVLLAVKELFARCMNESLQTSDCLGSPAAVKAFLTTRIGNLEHEVFQVLWLDAQNRLIVAEELFRGTLRQTSVYPREVVKRALAHNAAAAIFAHNHPSGTIEPSQADTLLTEHLKRALALVDVSVIDHFVVGGHQATSFAERGLL